MTELGRTYSGMDLDAKVFQPDEHIDPKGTIPYLLMHIGAVVGLFYFPFSWEVVAVIVVSYYVRMFGITAGFHRYFAHRSFKTGRFFQFILAFLGTAAAQKGVLWWSGLHRHHHRHSDMPEDIHSPRRGLWWAHQTWMLCEKYLKTPPSQEREYRNYPELLWMDKHWLVPPLMWAAGLWLLGGATWAFYGMVVSTVFLWHGTFTINSLSHVWGTRRYDTTDTSRNNLLLALLTLGEGWHNNHHFYQSSARQGFFWWEIDVSFYVLTILSWFGVVWDVRGVPDWAKAGKSRKHARQPSATYELPTGLVTRMATLEQLREQLEQRPARPEQVDIRTQVAETATDVARRAATAAQQAADAAKCTATASLTSRFRTSAVDAASRAAQMAEEASEAARETAEAVRDRMTAAMADAADQAAKLAADAAREAQHVAAG
ncbi:MAG: acyl-CoA desaturase [Myxococcota bacterium]